MKHISLRPDSWNSERRRYLLTFLLGFGTLLLVFLARGADEVTSKFGLNSDFSEILTGIILFFIIGCEFFINYQVHFNHHKKAAPVAESGEGH